MKNYIKIERARHNLTQGDLAEKVGVSRQTINSIETKKIYTVGGSGFKNCQDFQYAFRQSF